MSMICSLALMWKPSERAVSLRTYRAGTGLQMLHCGAPDPVIQGSSAQCYFSWLTAPHLDTELVG
jgi:hypothetical protein